MYKLSRYIVSVDFFEQENQQNRTIVYSTRSSRRIILDNETWIKLQNNCFELIQNSIIIELVKFKILVDQKEDELQIILNENKQSLHEVSSLFFSVQPSANCSLGCDYCGQEHDNTLLSESYQTSFLSRIKNKINQHHKSISICWFGAEPLNGIKVIRTLSPKIQSLAKNYDLSYNATVVTNGLSLTPDICHELINVFGVKKIEITIDGTKEFHDQRRHTKQKKGTFDRIYSNFLYLMDHYADLVEVSLRCNVDDRNKNNMPEFIDMISRDGILDHCNFYFAPIHSWGNDAHELIEDKESWANEQIGWFIRIKENGKRINILPERVKNLCMAVSRDSELIDSFGNLFKCTEVSLTPFYEVNGKNIHSIGHISRIDGLHNTEQHAFGSFYEQEKIKNFPCSKCPLLPVCGGMCPKEWIEGRNACPPIKFNIKERLLLSYIWSKQRKIQLNSARECHV